MNNKFFCDNRKKLEKDLKNKEMIILSSGKEYNFSGDETYKFRVNKNFYYYIGAEYSDVYAVFSKYDGKLVLKMFFDEVPKDMTRWIGQKYTKKKAMMDLGIDTCHIYTKDEMIKEIVHDIKKYDIEKVYMEISDDFKVQIEKYIKDDNDEDMYDFFIKQDMTYRDNYLGLCIFKKIFFDAEKSNINIEFDTCSKIASLHRPYKEECEIDCIKDAIKITNRAIRLVMKNIKECTTEKQVLAYLSYSTTKEGIEYNGFDPIIASGMNATTLHYNDNDSKIEKDSLVLMDIGYETNGYTSDVSRTIPTSGHFLEEQKMIYKIVLDTNKYVIDKIKVGMTFKELNEIAKQKLALGLFNAGLIKSDDELCEYYFHSVSHPLGLNTHDVRPIDGKIHEKMVITVEPGLYIKKMKIGIRIEDDIYVTSKKNIVLTEDIPKEIEDIEKCINNE